MMHLSQAASALNARLLGADATMAVVSTDSRSIQPGALFVALRGERFDAHDFLATVAKAGAAGALVDEAGAARGVPGLPMIVVPDTRLALGALAAHWRRRFSPALIAVAGSNGKTTTKEMLASILRAAHGEAQVLATIGNLNNEIGLPLTLLRMRQEHRCCAIEVGMNHKGEIDYLAGLAAPTISVVTNAQREHLEFMGSVEEVAEENSGVIRALPAEGVAVINGDDPHADTFRRAAAGRRVVEFSLERDATVGARWELRLLSSEITLRCPAGEARATLSIPGLHNVRNALAAAACAYAAGVSVDAISAGLNAFRPYSGRLQVKRAAGGATVIDDTYNANPDSVRAAIDVLAAAHGATVLVLGDMGEVGDQGPDFHSEVGRYARERGIGGLLALGESTAHTVAGFGEGARHFASAEDLIAALRRRLAADATVLVKGSRFMRMERVVEALTGEAVGVH